MQVHSTWNVTTSPAIAVTGAGLSDRRQHAERDRRRLARHASDSLVNTARYCQPSFVGDTVPL